MPVTITRILQCGLVSVVFFYSCGPSQRGIFGKKSPHEIYEEKIKNAGLEKTQLGTLWFAAADKALSQPDSVTLPFKETGVFGAEDPRAAGYIFDVRRGSRIFISISLTPPKYQSLFAELWEPGNSSDKQKLLAIADSTLNINFEADRTGKYIVRLQPELLQGLQYTLTVSTGPSLAFPVSETGNPKMISFWSAPRDNGARSHEGVDIKATFRTPAIAAADGYVQSVSVNRLGGKVVFMRPEGKNFVLYYAHLDTQIVREGQQVKMGEVLGLVGNTGNAVNTPFHLHFGVYARGGAVDPLPFIDPRITLPKEVNAIPALNKWLSTGSTAIVLSKPAEKADLKRKIQAGTALKILSASADFYKIKLRDDSVGFVSIKKLLLN